MNRLVPVVLIGLAVFSVAMVAWWRYETYGRDAYVNCELDALTRIQRDVPIGTSREELIAVLQDEWELDAGTMRVEGHAFTHCGWRSEGHVNARFDLLGDQVTGCELVGDVAGVKKHCEPAGLQR